MDTPCEVFEGRLDASGYGRVWDSDAGRQKFVHRLAWERAYGVSLTRLDVLHHACKRKACVNVAHLVLTTRWEHRQFHVGEGHPCEHGQAPACGPCRKAANVAAQRAWLTRQRELGRCERCLDPSLGQHRLCARHRAAENMAKRRQRAARRSVPSKIVLATPSPPPYRLRIPHFLPVGAR